MSRPTLIVSPPHAPDLPDLGGARYTAWIAKATGYPESIVRARVQVCAVGQSAEGFDEPSAIVLSGMAVANAVDMGFLRFWLPMMSNLNVSRWPKAPTYVIPSLGDDEPWWATEEGKGVGLRFLRCMIDPKRAENGAGARAS